jgi:sugar/nucleoside kinase (ribokinase family)
LECSDHVPAYSVDAVDPTGAGDAFTAATVASLLRNQWMDLHPSDIAYASAAGALATTRRGAMSSLPRQEEVETFLTERRT